MASTCALLKEVYAEAFEHHLFYFLHSDSYKVARLRPLISHLLHKGIHAELRVFLQQFQRLLDEVVPIFEQRRDINLELSGLEASFELGVEELDRLESALDQLGPDDVGEREKLSQKIASISLDLSELRLDQVTLESRRDEVDVLLAPLRRRYDSLRSTSVSSGFFFKPLKCPINLNE